MTASSRRKGSQRRLAEGARDIVMLAAVEWDSVVQAQQLFAVRFAGRGHNVVYVEPLPHRMPRATELGRVVRRFVGRRRTGANRMPPPIDVPPGVTVVSPVTLPETSAALRWLNRAMLLPAVARRIRSELASQPIVEVWKPLDGFRALLALVAPARTVYSCIDNYTHHDRAPRHLARVEERLVQDSDVVIAISPPVRDRLLRLRETVCFRDAGVDFELFSGADGGMRGDLRTLAYHGVISDRLDFGLITGLAARGFEVHLVGPVKRCPLDPDDPPPNIVFHGPVRYGDLPALLRPFDAFLFPYAINDYTTSIRPAKLYECFAAGKPVFSTPIPALYRYSDLIRFGSTAEEMGKLLADHATIDAESRILEHRARVEEARRHDWSALVDQELAWLLGPSSSEPGGSPC